MQATGAQFEHKQSKSKIQASFMRLVFLEPPTTNRSAFLTRNRVASKEEHKREFEHKRQHVTNTRCGGEEASEHATETNPHGGLRLKHKHNIDTDLEAPVVWLLLGGGAREGEG